MSSVENRLSMLIFHGFPFEVVPRISGLVVTHPFKHDKPFLPSYRLPSHSAIRVGADRTDP